MCVCDYAPSRSLGLCSISHGRCHIHSVFPNSANIMRMYTKLVLNDPVERTR